MKTALAIFVKTPELSPVKTRLAKGIGENNALKFYEFCLKKLQITASKAQSLSHNTIKPIWAVAETKGLNLQRWMNFERIYQGEGSLGERLHQVYSQLIQTHKSVIIIGSDSPQLKATDIVLASKQIKPAHFVVGPSEDGGFYLFASSTKLDKNDWLSINYSTNKTFDEFESMLNNYGSISHLPKEIDIDTIYDLKNLARQTNWPEIQRFFK